MLQAVGAPESTFRTAARSSVAGVPDGSLAVCDVARHGRRGRRGRLVSSDDVRGDGGLGQSQEEVEAGCTVGDDCSEWTSADAFIPANRLKKHKVRLLTMPHQQTRNKPAICTCPPRTRPTESGT